LKKKQVSDKELYDVVAATESIGDHYNTNQQLAATPGTEIALISVES
jgi:hypothetical protein